MNKRFLAYLGLVILLLFASCGSQEQPEELSAKPLYEKYPFPVGAACPTSAFTATNPQYPLLEYFNVYVAENDMKPESVLPSSKPANWTEAAYRWTNADKLVNYAQQNNKKVRGHVLIWHSQTPAWFFQGSGVDGRATKAELYANMENHIKTVLTKYKGKIDSWDVCNEVVDDNGSPRNSEYNKIMQDSGSDDYEYVLKAFEWAKQYDPDAQLYLTDYNTEYSGAKQDEFYRLVQYLKSNNAPLDGVGFQAHIKWDWPEVSDISAAIDRFAGLSLKTQVTELDMSLFSNNEGSVKTLSNDVRDSRLAIQAQKYRALFDMFTDKYNAGKLTMVLVWGLADGASWLNNYPLSGRTDYPLLFDRNYEPKDVFWKLME
jgi:endo-1,4-beta-xylanase